MATITKPDLINRLSELDARENVVASVEAALAALGWAGKDVFNGSETITLGTKMAELANQALAASADPAQRARAEATEPYLESLREDVLPHLDRNR